MDSVRQVVVSILTASVICGIVTKLVGEKGVSGAVTKMICGLFLMFTLISPIKELRLESMADLASDLSLDAQYAASEGEQQTRDALRGVIKERSETYILDKAAGMDATISVCVELSEDDLPVPIAVSLSGAVSPYTKGRLTSIITQDLGIPKEAQTWT